MVSTGGLGTGIVETTATPFTPGEQVDIVVNATAGAKVVNLPSLASVLSGGVGRSWRISKSDATVNTVTITPNGADTINGAATLVLTTQNDVYEVTAGPSGWRITSGPIGTGSSGGADLARYLWLWPS